VDGIEYSAVDLSDAAAVGPFAVEQARYPQTGGLNDAGDVAGLCDPGTNAAGTGAAARPFFFRRSGRTKTNLGHPDGDEGYAVAESCSAYGVNMRRWVAGGAGNWSYSRPFVWFDANTNGFRDGGEMLLLDLNPGDARGSAQSINDDGRVLVGGDLHLCRTRVEEVDGSLREAGPRTVILAGDYATDFHLNRHGDACWSISRTGFRKGYRWTDRNADGLAGSNEIAVLDSPWGGDRATANGINDAGQVCGSAMDAASGKKRAFLWTDANRNDIAEAAEFEALTADHPLSHIYPKDLNDEGDVVGDVAQGSDRFAFVWDRARGLRDLNGLFVLNHAARGAFTARQAYAVNRHGQIAVEGRYANTGNESYAVLLSPLPRIAGAEARDGDAALRCAGLLLDTTVTVERCLDRPGPEWEIVDTFAPDAPTADRSDVLPAGRSIFYRLQTHEAAP